MAIVLTDDKHYKAIADAIRYGWYVAFDTGFTGTYLPEEMGVVAKQIYSDCYSSGHNKGKAEGYNEGKAEGMSSFWDEYQENGNRKSYFMLFGGYGWTDKIYSSIKYDFGKPTNVQAMFRYASGITDTLKPLDCTEAPNLATTFDGCTNLRQIRLLTVKDSHTYTSTFRECYALEEIRFAGTIGNDIDFSSCKNLSIESLVNIVEHLSTTTTGKTITFSGECITKYYVSATDFSALTYGHENWTFALA